MRAGELKKVAKAYANLLPPEWKLNRTEFVRCVESWVQIVNFHSSQFDNKYIPRCCLEFLKMPGIPAGTFFVQELRYRKHRVQRWITMDEHSKLLSSIFDEMVAQFQPSIVEPLQIEEIRKLLEANLDYWPHPYALCIMKAEKADRREALKYFDLFSKATSGKPYDWVEHRRKELIKCLDQIGSPQELKMYLNLIQQEKLAEFRVPL